MWHNECWYSIEYTVIKSNRLKRQTETTRDSPRSVTGSAMYSLRTEIFWKCWFNHQLRIQNDWSPMSECTMNVAWCGNWFYTCILEHWLLTLIELTCRKLIDLQNRPKQLEYHLSVQLDLRGIGAGSIIRSAFNVKSQFFELQASADSLRTLGNSKLVQSSCVPWVTLFKKSNSICEHTSLMITRHKFQAHWRSLLIFPLVFQ